MVACRMDDVFHTHMPVLLDEAIQALAIQADGVYLDATFGRGGHAQAILHHLGPNGRLLAMDKDPVAVAFARQQFASDARFTIQQGSFATLTSFLTATGVQGKVNGILFDLGVSSPQLDDADRGFSFLRAGKLDMRMDTTQGIDAATWLTHVAEDTLKDVLWQYGEERFSRRIARAIVTARAIEPITTTKQLAEIVARAHPAWEKGKHPATRSFQAIRIYINHELDDIQQGLSQALEALSVGGRLAVISFHSLEDRLIKQFIQHHARGDDLPPGLPVKWSEVLARLKKTSRAIKPSEKEVANNPRARSAILRIAEKLS